MLTRAGCQTGPEAGTNLTAMGQGLSVFSAVSLGPGGPALVMRSGTPGDGGAIGRQAAASDCRFISILFQRSARPVISG